MPFPEARPLAIGPSKKYATSQRRQWNDIRSIVCLIAELECKMGVPELMVLTLINETSPLPRYSMIQLFPSYHVGVFAVIRCHDHF